MLSQISNLSDNVLNMTRLEALVSSDIRIYTDSLQVDSNIFLIFLIFRSYTSTTHTHKFDFAVITHPDQTSSTRGRSDCPVSSSWASLDDLSSVDQSWAWGETNHSTWPERKQGVDQKRSEEKIWRFLKRGVPPVIIHFSMIFPCKPSIFWYSHLWKPPYEDK